jgi:manganese transport protein
VAVAIDFSSKDQQTISQALSIGGRDARYLLVHIVESAGALMMEKDISDRESGEDQVQLERYIGALKAQGFEAEYALGFGKPSKEIPGIVTRFNSDLLVMGGHGHRGLKDLIFGETINAVRHRVKIPVLAVK